MTNLQLKGIHISGYDSTIFSPCITRDSTTPDETLDTSTKFTAQQQSIDARTTPVGYIHKYNTRIHVIYTYIPWSLQ